VLPGSRPVPLTYIGEPVGFEPNRLGWAALTVRDIAESPGENPAVNAAAGEALTTAMPPVNATARKAINKKAERF